MKKRLAFGIALLVAAPGVTIAQAPEHSHLPAQAGRPDWNWADEASRITQEPEFAASKAICRRLRDLDPPARDWPDPKTAATLSDCSSGSLYYGIDIPADPVHARQCALLETQRPGGNGGPFMGIGVLMMIYANGRGRCATSILPPHSPVVSTVRRSRSTAG